MDKIDVLVPDGRSGPWRVETMTLTDADVRLGNLRAMLHRQPQMLCDPGAYKRLIHDRRGTVMTNTPMEVRTNSAFIRAARGDVHINGLGLGMVLTAILAKSAVKSVTVVEIEKDVIALVAPTFQRDIDSGRLSIINADCYEYTPPKGRRYAAVWHDVWDEICDENAAAMTKLRRKFARRADWQGCWSQDMLRGSQ